MVLVHGLGGHPIDTWTYTPPKLSLRGLGSALKMNKSAGGGSDQGSVCWPVDLLPNHIPNVRVLTWGYNANPVNILGGGHQSNIYHHATNLLSDLAMERGEDVRI